MFDIDGTLVESYEMDSLCFIDAVKEVTGLSIDSDWSKYKHVTDSGILDEILHSEGFSNKEEIKSKVKEVFVKNIEDSLDKQAVKEISGAAEFIKLLKSMDNVIVSLATGGWKESAILKLNSAGIDISSIPLASANDHYSRTEIMKHAFSITTEYEYPCTYFGDGEWDKNACNQLGYNFVLVGNRLNHTPSIKNFKHVDAVLACVGL